VRQSIFHLIATCALYYKSVIETVQLANTHCNQEPRVQLNYGLCRCSLVCHHLQHRIISAQHDTINSGQLLQQRKPGKQQRRECVPAITQRGSLRWSVIVQPFLPPESHQCYATSTPTGNEAARVRHLKWDSGGVAPSGGGGQHSHCLT
jgi:hypothetical protein